MERAVRLYAGEQVLRRLRTEAPDVADAREALMAEAVRLYAGEQVLRRLREEGERALALGHSAVEVTMLCQDLRSYTGAGGGVPPGTAEQLLRDYLSAMTEPILSYAGFLDHYEGCAFLAYWLARDPEHAQKACRAAAACLQAAREVAGRWTHVVQHITPMMGVHTGIVAIGNVGAPNRLQYTMVGSAVNLTWRLVGANRDCGTQILISETTQAALAGRLATQMVRRFDLAGGGAVTVYTLKNL